VADEQTDTTKSVPETPEPTQTPTQAEAAEAPAPADEPSLMSKAAEGGDKEPEADGEPVADIPEAYALEAPEGYEISEALIGEVTPILKEVGLSNEAANKLLPAATRLVEHIQSQQADAFSQVKAQWAKDAQSSPDLGGNNWGDTERFVAKALDTAALAMGKKGADEVGDFKQLLDQTGLGNHPTMLRMFRLFGERVSEDTDFVRDDKGAPVKRSREEILYGKKDSES
jgi:hypothetical protein